VARTIPPKAVPTVLGNKKIPTRVKIPTIGNRFINVDEKVSPELSLVQAAEMVDMPQIKANMVPIILIPILG